MAIVMTGPARRAILVLGLPDTGVERVTRTLIAAGAVLANDASREDGTFAVPAGLEQYAAALCGELQITPDDPGPLGVGGKSFADSRAAIVESLSDRATGVAELVARSCPVDGAIVLTGPHIALMPRFWYDALAAAGVATHVVLADRNPLALVDIARASQQRIARRSLFLWHYQTLETLAATPDAMIVAADAASPGTLLAALGLKPLASWATPPLRPQPRDKAALTAFPVVSPQTRALHDLIGRWNDLDRDDRRAATAQLVAQFDDALAVAGIGRQVHLNHIPRRKSPAKARPAPRVAAPAPLRPLLIHYHLFKNAGTSVDAMLRENFDERWAEEEFGRAPIAEKHAALIAYIAAHPELDAISSHTALLPPPAIAGRSVLPIIFVRHPLLRLRSAYAFERAQDAQTAGAILAKQTDFAGYATTILAEPRNRQARNFQVARFAFGTPGKPDCDVERALATEAALPFVGLVERYDRSIARLGECVTALFPGFRPTVFHRNITDGDSTDDIVGKLDRLRADVGAGIYDRLIQENQGDLALFERVRARYPEA